MIDISNPQVPTVEAEYREPENDPSTCDDWNPPRTSYSAHNPTLTPHIACSTWHSGGFQAVSVANPRAPYQLAEFLPEPLDSVMLEDPRLSSDPDTGRNEKVVMWSYAVVQDGLIYVVDLRNGLYVLKYRGAYSKEVKRIGFLDGTEPGRRTLLRAGGPRSAALPLTPPSDECPARSGALAQDGSGAGPT